MSLHTLNEEQAAQRRPVGVPSSAQPTNRLFDALGKASWGFAERIRFRVETRSVEHTANAQTAASGGLKPLLSRPIASRASIEHVAGGLRLPEGVGFMINGWIRLAEKKWCHVFEAGSALMGAYSSVQVDTAGLRNGLRNDCTLQNLHHAIASRFEDNMWTCMHSDVPLYGDWAINCWLGRAKGT